MLHDGDERLLASLALDGRAGYPDLAKVTGWSDMTVKRRLEQLRSSGALFFDVDVDPHLLGYAAVAMLWLTVEPAALRRTADVMAAQPEVAFAAATTGPTNLMAIVVCRDVDALYDYLEQQIGSLPGIRQIESAPVIRNSKRTGVAPQPSS